MNHELIRYSKEYREDLIEIFKSNMPKYFDPSELAPFEGFLDEIQGDYFVCKVEGKTLAGGGYARIGESEARICWLMVANELHGKGLGRFMMQQFYDLVIADGSFSRITLKTTQHTDKFYETLGYKTTLFEEDHWVKGMHLYFMEQDV